jgi:ferredoxin-thioredoxin reductase catalytic subunit
MSGMTPEQLYDILSKYAASQGIRLNSDREFVMDILPVPPRLGR